jgi:hypothetical protein
MSSTTPTTPDSEIFTEMATPLLNMFPNDPVNLGFRVARDGYWPLSKRGFGFSETNRVKFSAQLNSDNVIYM